MSEREETGVGPRPRRRGDETRPSPVPTEAAPLPALPPVVPPPVPREPRDHSHTAIWVVLVLMVLFFSAIGVVVGALLERSVSLEKMINARPVAAAPVAPSAPALTKSDVERIANEELNKLLADKLKVVGLVAKCEVTQADLDRLRDEVARKGHTHVAPVEDGERAQFVLIGMQVRELAARLTALEQVPPAAAPVDLSEVNRRIANLELHDQERQSTPGQTITFTGRNSRLERKLVVEDE